MLPAPYDLLSQTLQQSFPKERLITDPLRTLAYGTDASFYRLTPKIVVIVESEEEVTTLLEACKAQQVAVTFRAAGTSLSGQAVTDSVLALLGNNWRGFKLNDDASLVSLQPGVIGAIANARLAPHGKKIGPDPASINTAMIGGIAANNSSGMCCGTAQNSYNTLSSMRIIFHDGTLLDTGDDTSRAIFEQSHKPLLNALSDLSDEIKKNQKLAERIRTKFKIKNTTGYSLNALIDFDDPFEILQHLMIGSEGTLGFIAEVTYKTVVDHINKATAMVYFETAEIAAKAVPLLKVQPVSAVELIDRAGLRSVENKPGMPAFLKTLPGEATALLIETRAEDAAHLEKNIELITQSIAEIDKLQPVEFSTDPDVGARYWSIRKGLFPLVGAMRETGTSVIIEDVAFPIEHLAAGVVDLHHLFKEHGYNEAIIFGHALEGNLHFVFTQDFNTDEEVARYGRFMDAVCDMVVHKYDGSLKAEHGTGRNMAPFVEMEWGAEAFDIMWRLKRLFDPNAILNPGVILNDDKDVHLKDLKPMPAADTVVDKCIECGFCEPKCPSKGMTLSPRQRIVGWREISRLPANSSERSELLDLYAYQGIDTCAACGLCATACPVGIETGILIKALRGKNMSNGGEAIGKWFADHYGGAMAATSMGLKAANLAHGILGSKVMASMNSGLRKLSGNRVPRWVASMPNGTSFTPVNSLPQGKPKVVYLSACSPRTMGPAKGDPKSENLPTVIDRLLQKAGFEVIYPKKLGDLCCGQPWESKGLKDIADAKADEMEQALAKASNNGEYPIICDTSPCSYRMIKHMNGRLKMKDVTEFLFDEVLGRLKISKTDRKIALHSTCSNQKMGLDGKLAALAKACSNNVVIPDGVGCCGWAGDKGFTTPELNNHALRYLNEALEGVEEGYSSSRTCEIGLSNRAGFPYRSIAYLLDEVSTAGSDQ